MKTKTSMSIPPDKDSVVQAIQRVHYQAFHWYRCIDIRIPDISLEDHGWKIDQDEGTVLPTWFTGSQLPPSFKKRRKQRRATDCEDHSGDADISDIDEDGMGEISVRQASAPTQGIERLEDETGYSADTETVLNEHGDNLKNGISQNDSDSNDDESDWEVSDFTSSEDSCDEWLP